MDVRWRLIIDGKHNGYYNMAVDEAILINYLKDKRPTLRIYGWRCPFITLGYNQKAENVLHSGCKVSFVRRITGGAAILHHQELTYSLVCATSDLTLPKRVKESFRYIATFLIKFYAKLGIIVQFAQDFPGTKVVLGKETLGEYKDFCFSSWEHYDLLAGGKKIGGNAQKRKKNIIFQQGSIPQAIDFKLAKQAIRNLNGFQSKITSLNEILNHPTNFAKLQNLLAESFQETFDLRLEEEELTVLEKQSTKALLKDKYRNIGWNQEKKIGNLESYISYANKT